MSLPEQLDPNNMPAHIAIIMDGNGRWAQQKNMIRTMGHKAGVETVQEIVRVSRQLGIKVLTLYAFSSENWQRPALEVKTLMVLLKTYLKKEIANMKKNNICLKCIGEKNKLPPDVVKTLDQTISETSMNTGMVLNLALSYGSRNEIVMAVKNIAEQVQKGLLEIDQISTQSITDNLYTYGLPDPDLLIRTGGESRLSNFLLWQASYSEIFITEAYWPDFKEDNLIMAIQDYQTRQRRFGKTGEQVL